MATSSAVAKGREADGAEEATAGGFAKDVASVLFCGAFAQLVAYPLGLGPAAALAMGIQVVAWIPSSLARSEKFYDLTGMLTFMVLAVFSQVGSMLDFFGKGMLSEHPLRPVIDAPRHLIATVLVLVWTTRLGTFLFQRIRRDGHDSRFNGVRDRPLSFLLFWCVQGMWVFLTPLPMLALHKVDPQGGSGSLGRREAIGLAAWLAGFTLEVIADNQKRAFKADAANAGKFIDVGLWSRCRHPNYVGEMVIWTGFFIFCSRGVLGGWGWLTLAGPAFVAAILVLISAPTLESGADRRYGGQVAYQQYKRRAPSLFFRLW